MLDWEAEDLSSKKDKGILRFRLDEGQGKDSPKEGTTVLGKEMGILPYQFRSEPLRTFTSILTFHIDVNRAIEILSKMPHKYEEFFLRKGHPNHLECSSQRVNFM